jgi:putative spermidine/putrescine transport system ATP-binding protein
VFQNYALFPHLTVAQNVAYPLTVRKVDKAAQAKRVAKALEMVQLRGMTERYPAQLSGGQQQRVALARALVFEPQLVLMDEPLGALDKQLREHMQIELKELHRQLGVTFVYVTHDQSEALTMSDRVAVFNDGAIQQIDVVDRMYETPANRFVAGFIGDSTMLNGTVRASDAERCGIVLTDGRVLTGVNVNGAPVGAAVQAGIRPERIGLHAQAPAERSNVLQARVASVIYFGDHLRLLCSVGDGQSDSTVKLPLSAPGVPAVDARLCLSALCLMSFVCFDSIPLSLHWSTSHHEKESLGRRRRRGHVAAGPRAADHRHQLRRRECERAEEGLLRALREDRHQGRAGRIQRRAGQDQGHGRDQEGHLGRGRGRVARRGARLRRGPLREA